MTNKQNQKLVEEVMNDYLSRREARRSLESQWQLNINFMMGNQYSYIASNGALREDEKQYFWQEKEVFNHIAPIIETRISKICENSPNVTVVPASGDTSDIESAKLSKSIINSVINRLNFADIIKTATTWSEICGTVFYKVVWDTSSGKMIASDEEGNAINEGDVSIEVVSPFEIFPDNMSCERMEDVKSIIHARAMEVDAVRMQWGVQVDAEDVQSLTLDSKSGNLGGLGYNAHINKVANMELNNHCIVVERYVRPTKKYPNGRLTIVAGGKLLFDGELPYINGELSTRTFPFVKQISNYMPGNFYGVSVVDRLIPLQRAYNAVRNRKHEYFNRTVMNVLAVEDGSVDTDALEIEGLSPGKVLVYRQGSKIPEIMQNPKSVIDFESEEERLLGEFKSVSGVSDMMTDSYAQYTSMSGVALELLAEQDASRLSTAIDSSKYAVKIVAKFLLRLYKQFAVVPRLLKISGDSGKIQMYYWDKNEICSDDVVFDASSDKNESLVQRRTMLLDLIKQGLLYDEDGKFSHSMRKKCLDLLGFGTWENAVDLPSLHVARAKEENLELEKKQIEVMPIDDHKTHIDEHIAYILNGELKNKVNKKTIEERILAHIKEHKEMMKGE
ncbi:MAG: hypothetical protein E7374_03700 [Clostridiales bacterium]|nr:hypothetical protein [Clostridiales bacterium]